MPSIFIPALLQVGAFRGPSQRDIDKTLNLRAAQQPWLKRLNSKQTAASNLTFAVQQLIVPAQSRQATDPAAATPHLFMSFYALVYHFKLCLTV